MNTENTLNSELKSLSKKIRQYRSGEGVPDTPCYLTGMKDRLEYGAVKKMLDYKAAYKDAWDQALNIMQKFAGLTELTELPKNESDPMIGLRYLEEWCYTNSQRVADEHFKNPAEAGQKIEPGKEPPEKATKGKMLTQRKAETKAELELISDYREQFNKWGQETIVVEANKTFGQMQTALSELNDILQHPQHETSEETLTQARLLRDEIADCVRGTEQYLDRLQPLQKMVLYFADSGYNIATKIARGRAEKELPLEVTTLKRKCESLRSFVSFRCSDFRCLQRELALNWNNRVLQLRVDLTGFDKVFLELRDEQYDRYGDFIESLEKKYKAITDYFDKVEHKPRLVRREPAEKDRESKNGEKAKRSMLKMTVRSSKDNWEAIKSEYGISKMVFGKKINFVSDSFKRKIIFRDVEHAFVLASEGFAKPAVILAGGVIEELLRLYLEYKGIKPQSKKFIDYIKTCDDNKLLKRGVSRLSDSTRDFRNLVHLSNEKTSRYTISKPTAKGAVASIFTIANDFQKVSSS